MKELWQKLLEPSEEREVRHGAHRIDEEDPKKIAAINRRFRKRVLGGRDKAALRTWFFMGWVFLGVGAFLGFHLVLMLVDLARLERVRVIPDRIWIVLALAVICFLLAAGMWIAYIRVSRRVYYGRTRKEDVGEGGDGGSPWEERRR